MSRLRHRTHSYHETGRARGFILALAARRKGIARCAALHLDCARSVRRGAYRFAFKRNCMPRHLRASWRKRDSPQLLHDAGFHSFEFLLWNRPAFCFFNQVVEQDLSSAAFAAVGESFPGEFTLKL